MNKSVGVDKHSLDSATDKHNVNSGVDKHNFEWATDKHNSDSGVDKYDFDWADLAFSSKKPLNSLNAVFIAAPRELSVARFKQLIKTYLPTANIVLGLAKEEFIAGFEGQPQFRTLQRQTIAEIISKVNVANNKNTNKSNTANKIYTLSYSQTETNYLFEKLDFKLVLMVNGSWKYAFHTRDIFYTLAQRKTAYQLISPFVNEAEAQAYLLKTDKLIELAYPLPKNGCLLPKHSSLLSKQHSILPKNGSLLSKQGSLSPRKGCLVSTQGSLLTDQQMLGAAQQSAFYSYDYCFQTGAVLGKKSGLKYLLLTTAFNKVVPYQTFAMLHGASRETNFSPPNDLNHYDTIHAEVEILLNAQKQGLDIKNSSLFINLLPCPTCARMICDSDIQEVFYQSDHSNGYAIAMLQKANKIVSRLIPNNIRDTL